MYRLRENEGCDAGAKRIILERVETTIALLTEPTDNQDKAIHDSRKNFKRIRAVLRLIRDGIGDEAYRYENACYRDASRKLAPLRDSAVMVETIDAIKKYYRAGLANNAFASIRQTLVARQMHIREEFLANQRIPFEVAETLHEARLRLLELPFADKNFKVFAGGLQRVYRRGRRGMSVAYTTPEEAELFHEWRKRVKYLWYQMEILQPLWPPVQDELAHELHQISKYLGDAHDLFELNRVLHEEGDLFVGEPQLGLLLTLISQRRHELEMAARPLGQRMYIDQPRDFVRRLATYWQIWQQHGINGVPHKSAKTKSTKINQQLLGTKEVAEHLDLPIGQVRKLIAEGKIEAFKIGNIWAIPQSVLTS